VRACVSARRGIFGCVYVSVQSFPCSLQVARGRISAPRACSAEQLRERLAHKMDTHRHAQRTSLVSTGKGIDGGGEEKGREGGRAKKHVDV